MQLGELRTGKWFMDITGDICQKIGYIRDNPDLGVKARPLYGDEVQYYCTIAEVTPCSKDAKTSFKINGYDVRYNGFYRRWQVSHKDIGANLAEFQNLADAVEECERG